MLDLKSGEKLVVNGAVLENAGGNTKILVHNQVAILREKEILSTDECATPASRVYFALQCAYMFPNRKADYLKLFENHLGDYLTACPSAAPIGIAIQGHVSGGRLYKGLKETRKLIHHEMKTLANLPTSVAKLFELAGNAHDADHDGAPEADHQHSE